RNMPKQILIVDDNAAHGAQMESLLAATNFAGQHVTSARYASQLLAQAPFDAVITRIAMPVQDGLELLRLIRRQYPHLPAIGMTDGVAPTKRLFSRAFEAMGGAAVLETPVTRPELLHVLRGLLCRAA